MDIRQLKRFVTVAEHGSFNKASDILAVSQPSLSRSIQQLEDTLDIKLFERGSQGITLTSQARELLPHARIILTERDRALETINSLRGRREEAITIGTEAMFIMHRLPLAISRLAVTTPQLQITVVEDNIHELVELVKEGSVRMAFGARAPTIDLTGLVFEQLSDEGASMLMRAGHPLLKKGKPKLKDVVNARWIVPDDTMVTQGWKKIFLDNELPVPEIGLRTSSLLLMKGCLLNSDFISLGNHREYADEIKSGQLIQIDFGQSSYSRPAGIFWREEARLSQSEKTLINTLRKVCQ
ncbi:MULTISPECIES: LysR family transcriptional regulator [Aliiglaciecola]|uniref:LysR family transcriptional regulator n=1 Tax=Aliiglaciecola TaxID=1406885 RepID=UPI001C08945C|nr:MULTISPECIES: LysR family transcriptional regulator [Aliiglaciecola]MBU2878989.1 LysR family transcriptional regulator [Aliiglaciecola lipolytica]MDO6710690.1 LysR family transcriptional regulator [Aliiglaciecola sp. 2_MG-2023]MDO6751902.1 LysR family transcriptional regulator [Aliiglaciecola sp. 1_MG-2023]